MGVGVEVATLFSVALIVAEGPSGVGVGVFVSALVGGASVTPVSVAGGVSVRIPVAVTPASGEAEGVGVANSGGSVGNGRGVRVGGGSKLRALCGLKKMKVQ